MELWQFEVSGCLSGVGYVLAGGLVGCGSARRASGAVSLSEPSKALKAALVAISQSLRAGPTSLLLLFFIAGHHPPIELDVLNRQY